MGTGAGFAPTSQLLLAEPAMADGSVPSTTTAAIADLLWKPMNSVYERFGDLDGLLMLQQIDACYLVHPQTIRQYLLTRVKEGFLPK